jgi:DNA-binding GntR family transcriptional regulator
VDLQRRLFNQSRRFRLALLREDRIDFGLRRANQRKIVDAILARDTTAAVDALLDDIKAELKPEI